MKTLEKILTLFIGIGAIAGAVMMWIDPTGATWGGESLLEMLRAKMPWPNVFFRDFIPSGFVLLGLNGITQLLAAFLLFRKHHLAQYAVLACGIILMLWIVLEWWVWGFNAMSNIYFVFGMAEAAMATYYQIQQNNVFSTHKFQVSVFYRLNSTRSKYKGTGAGKDAQERMKSQYR